MWRGGDRNGQWPLTGGFRRGTGASGEFHSSVSTSRSSNRTCGLPASGSRTRVHAFAHRRRRGKLRPAHRAVLLGRWTAVGPVAAAVVRGRLRYDGAVRLPVLVHRRLAPVRFTVRTATPSPSCSRRIHGADRDAITVAAKGGTSQFLSAAPPYVHGVYDRAGPGRISR